MSEKSISDLYSAIVAAGIETDSHESDLYVRASQEAWNILGKHGRRGLHTFIFEGRMWIDVPFAYTPFWEGKAAHD